MVKRDYFLKERKIDKETDLLHILKNLQDIENLKRILLSEDQLCLFKLLSKPMIYLPRQESPSILKSKKNNNDVNDVVVKAYIRRKEKNSELDKRILELLDKDIKNFVENKK